MLFDPGDAAGLAGILRRLAAGEETRKRLADSAMRFVRENFAVAVAARHGSHLREALSSG